MIIESVDYIFSNMKDRKLNGGIIIKNETSLIKMERFIQMLKHKNSLAFLYFYYDEKHKICQKDLYYLLEKEEFTKNTILVRDSLEEEFCVRKYYYPEIFVGMNEEEVLLLQKIKERQIAKICYDLDSYYSKKDMSQLKFDKSFKLLSILWKVSKDFSRDIKQALEPIGVQCFELLKSADCPNEYSYHWDEFSYMNILNDIRPDAIFTVFTTKNTMRYYIPKKMIVFTELDIPANIMVNHNEFLKSLDRYNICLLPGKTIKKVTGIPKEEEVEWDKKTVSFDFTCNHNIFNKIELTETEKEYYGSDVCIVGGYHSSDQFWEEIDRQYHMKDLRNSKIFKKIIAAYYQISETINDEVLKEEKLVTDKKWFSTIINDAFEQQNLSITKQELNQHCWSFMFNYSCFLLSGNFLDALTTIPHSIKFWGSDYINIDRFKKLSMGWIDNSIDLVKVYNASKICVCVNIPMPLHRRLIECTLCGVLCITYRPIEAYNMADTDVYFKENDSIVYFSSTKELFMKIDYYLKHEEERVQIVERAKKIVMENELYTDRIYREVLIKGFEKIIKQERMVV